MAYIYPAPGVAAKQVTLSISDSTGGLTGTVSLPALQDVTVNAANDVFTWTQLDTASKNQIATTATNSLSMNLVLDKESFFGTDDGDYANSTTMAGAGVFGCSTLKTRISFTLYMGDESDGTEGVTLTGNGYITGLAPTVSADAPVWVSPITITVDGDYTVDDTATP
jgi:hypothetical protein